MESKTKPLVDKIKQLILEIRSLKSDIFNENNSFATQQNKSRNLSFKQSKLKSYLKKFDNLGKGNIIRVSYELDGMKLTAVFTNISREDAVEILNFRALMVSSNIKILEIKEISTSINNPNTIIL